MLHGRISIGDNEAMAVGIRMPSRCGAPLRVESDGEADRIFSALSEGGKVLMPIKDTFFASRFGQVRDRFGINWMILHERPMPPRA